jgi:hypothetical protein
MRFCHQITSPYSVIDDAIFGRMDDIGDMLQHEVHEEFITNSLFHTQPCYLPEYSYLYVLVAHETVDNGLIPINGEKKWKDILTTSQYIFLKKHHAFIVAWMLMDPEHPKDVHWIEYADSRIPKYQLVDCMIRKYENEVAMLQDTIDARCNNDHVMIKPKCVLPRRVCNYNVLFWKKYLARRYDIHTSEDVCRLVNNLRIGHIVHWNVLTQNTNDGSLTIR